MRKKLLIYFLLFVFISFVYSVGDEIMEENKRAAILGGGCFWCIEAVFENIEGIISAESGYAGGENENPSYDYVSSGKSGHAEVVKIVYEKKIITYEQILELFFKAHDPTSLNRQGADVGTQYRSVVIYTSKDQKKAVEKYIKKLEKSKYYDKPIVTEVLGNKEFYLAEDYHQDYYEKHPNAAYCSIVIRPKLEKLGLE